MNLDPIDLAKFTQLPDGNLHVKLSRFGSLTVELPNGQAIQVYITRDKEKSFRGFVTSSPRKAGEVTTYALAVDGRLVPCEEKHSAAERAAMLGRKAEAEDSTIVVDAGAEVSGAAAAEAEPEAVTV